MYTRNVAGWLRYQVMCHISTLQSPLSFDFAKHLSRQENIFESKLICSGFLEALLLLMIDTQCCNTCVPCASTAGVHQLISISCIVYIMHRAPCLARKISTYVSCVHCPNMLLCTTQQASSTKLLLLTIHRHQCNGSVAGKVSMLT